MNVADLNVLYLIHNGERLGALRVRDREYPWVYCRFAPTRAFDHLRPLFDAEIAALYAQPHDPAAIEAAAATIAALELRLVTADTERDIGAFVLHIRGDEAWFRY